MVNDEIQIFKINPPNEISHKHRVWGKNGLNGVLATHILESKLLFIVI